MEPSSHGTDVNVPTPAGEPEASHPAMPSVPSLPDRTVRKGGSAAPYLSRVLDTPALIEMEHRVLGYWRASRTFDAVRAKNESKPLFRFLDGPVTANNPLGIHHGWGRILKDITLRFQALRGFSCHYQPGFDCHGLWVELQVEREMGFKGKEDIRNFGLENFSRACKDRVLKYSGIQAEQSQRLGMWLDFTEPYHTHSDTNIQGIWNFMKTAQERGWLYRSQRVMPWSPRCGTSLSDHELAGSYKTLTHTAVTVKAAIPALGADLLVWTTTPWTLAANTAVAVNPSCRYSKIELEGQVRPCIVGSEALSALKGKSYKVTGTYQGTDLIGLAYEPFLSDLSVQQDFPHKIVPWKDVNPKDGTGAVHIAPGCGPEDFELGKNLGLKIISPVNEEGVFGKDLEWLEGFSTQTAAEAVLPKLASCGVLFNQEQFEHSCPVCWRSGVEVIYRLVDEWFISSKEIRPQLLEAVKNVNWDPPYLQANMEHWLETMGDWCISRKRFWGVPLPIYTNEDGSEVIVVGSKDELRSLAKDPAKVDALKELHRPWIDDIELTSPKTGATLRRVPEVGDAWLDSGITFMTTKGLYADPRHNQGWGPADYVVEMSEQVRLWFYSLLHMCVTMTGQAPYANVHAHEKVVSEDGTKFSKTGKMIESNQAADTMGADVARYIYAKQKPTSEVRFSFGLAEDPRKQLIGLLNAKVFFETYAGIEKEPPVVNPPAAPADVTDVWLHERLNTLISKTRRAYERRQYPEVLAEFETFSDDLSNFYIRNNRRRFWKGGSGDAQKAAYSCLYEALKTVAIVMSPIVPFTAEAIWQDVVRKYDRSALPSVHLADWPDTIAPDQEVLRDAGKVREVLSIAHHLRSDRGLKVRQPLAGMWVSAPAEVIAALKPYGDLIKREVNVVGLKEGRAGDLYVKSLKVNLRKAAPVLKKDTSRLVSTVNGLSPEVSAELAGKVEQGEALSLEGLPGEYAAELFETASKPRDGLAVTCENGITVALDTVITPELRDRGWVRDLIRHIQVLRKDSGFEVVDRIAMSIETDSDAMRQAVLTEKNYLEDEVLGTMVPGEISEPEGKMQIAVGESIVTISVKRVPLS